MSTPNIDEVVNYLSTKFNKIFCDRDFVCCVNEEFRYLLENKNKCCVLVFPVLGPIYLKAVRYHAKISDLAVFGVSSGRFKSVAICHKQYLLKKSTELKEETMSECCPSATRRKRPERQLYVPPAQRKSRLHKEKSRSTSHSPQQNHIENNSQVVAESSNKLNEIIDNNAYVNSSCNFFYNEEKIFSLRDVVDYWQSLSFTNFISRYNLTSKSSVQLETLNFNHHQCEFNNFIIYKKFYKDSWASAIPVYSFYSNNIFFNFLNLYFLCWQPEFSFVNINDTNKIIRTNTYPLFNFTLSSITVEGDEMDKSERRSVLVTSGKVNTDKENSCELNVLKIECDVDQCCDCVDDQILDLSVINLGHFFLIQNFSEDTLLHHCLEDHNIMECYLNKKQQNHEIAKEKSNELLDIRETTPEKEKLCIQENNIKNSSKPVPNNKTELIKQTVNGTKDKRTKDKKSPIKKNEHEEEKEIMRKAKENINRKTRPIIKYVDDSNDTLKIGKNDDVNNWEDLFDDDGELQEDLFTEIVHKVGNDVTIVKATEDYTAYSAKPMEELEHVVEVYNFPPTLETHDIIQAFSEINSEAMYIKWVDDTHALLVLGSLTQAQKAVEMENPLIKVRPMSAASGLALAVAYKSDLKPAMKRPQTNLQTARRLITNHLGTKSRVSKEQSAREREHLQSAKAQKKLAKQNEKDAWEGNLRSIVK